MILLSFSLRFPCFHFQSNILGCPNGTIESEGLFNILIEIDLKGISVTVYSKYVN